METEQVQYKRINTEEDIDGLEAGDVVRLFDKGPARFNGIFEGLYSFTVRSCEGNVNYVCSGTIKDLIAEVGVGEKIGAGEKIIIIKDLWTERKLLEPLTLKENGEILCRRGYVIDNYSRENPEQREIFDWKDSRLKEVGL